MPIPVRVACAVIVFTLAAPVIAEEQVLYNQIHLDAQAERELENDCLEVVMVVERGGASPDQVSTEVNEIMAWALKLAKSDKDIDVATRAYHTWPEYRNRTIIGWRTTQELVLTSTDIDGLTGMVGKLQERLEVRNMGFSPTPESRRKLENALIAEAMAAFRERAGIIGQQMDGKPYRIVNLSVNTGQSMPVMYREMMMSKAVADSAAMAPAVEAGTSKVVVTVSGSIQFY